MPKDGRFLLEGWAEMLHPHPNTSLFWTTAGTLGGGDSPLLFRTLSEILPTKS